MIESTERLIASVEALVASYEEDPIDTGLKEMESWSREQLAKFIAKTEADRWKDQTERYATETLTQRPLPTWAPENELDGGFTSADGKMWCSLHHLTLDRFTEYLRRPDNTPLGTATVEERKTHYEQTAALEAVRAAWAVAAPELRYPEAVPLINETLER